MQLVLTEIERALHGVGSNEWWLTFKDAPDLRAVVIHSGSSLNGAPVIRYEIERDGAREVLGIDLIEIRWGWITFKNHLFGSVGAGLHFREGTKVPFKLLQICGLQVNQLQSATA